MEISKIIYVNKGYWSEYRLHESDITYKILSKTRSLTQNRALHLFFKWMSDELNNIGLTFQYRGLRGQYLDIPYTEYLVKETIWKPIQKTLFDIDSTTELTTIEINTILDVLIKFFGEKGIRISFPNRFDLIVEQLNKQQ